MLLPRFNHPHKERDFGAFEHNGERIFSKIDYYDTTMTKGAKTQATRARPSGFWTIVLASEYWPGRPRRGIR